MSEMKKQNANFAERRKRIAAIKDRIEKRAKTRAEHFAKRKAVKS